jgi:sarcosine oxidase subunit beta
MTLLPFLRDLRILRQWMGVCDMSPDYSPIMGVTGVAGFYITTGWGAWGFKAIPAGGEQLAGLIAMG